MQPIKLQYSEHLIRQTMRAYWKRKIGLKLPLVTLLTLIMLVYLIYSGYRDWLVGALGAILLIGIATMIAVYVVHLNRSLNRFRRMKQPTATLELKEDYFKITTGTSLAEIEWSQISEIWQFDKAWLIFFSANEFMTLPTADISEEEKSFIINRTKKASRH